MGVDEDAGLAPHHAVSEQVAGAPNVLFLAPTMGDVPADACLDCFLRGAPADARVLAVSYTRTVDQWLASWRERAGHVPEQLTVVTMDSTTRSATAAADDTSMDGTVSVEPCESPDDLTGLGITLGQHLSAWAEDDAPVYLCFDSLTVLLQYADLQRAFRFLHVLSGRVAGYGGHAHYHLDPTAVDDRAVATLTSLFDATVAYEDGEWQVRTR